MAQATYDTLKMHPSSPRRKFDRSGEAERHLCWLKFFQRTLTDQLLSDTTTAADSRNERFDVRDLLKLRGEFELERGKFCEAITTVRRYIEMTHEVGLSASGAEGRLSLALVKTGETQQARRLLNKASGDVNLAELYFELGDREKARYHALAGYRWAWTDGPPYSRSWELERCRAVLAAVGGPEPILPSCDAKTVEPIPQEAAIRRLLSKIKRANKVKLFPRK